MAGGHRSRRRDQYDQYLINHGIDADLLQLGHDECTAVTPTAVTLTAPACTREWRVPIPNRYAPREHHGNKGLMDQSNDGYASKPRVCGNCGGDWTGTACLDCGATIKNIADAIERPGGPAALLLNLLRAGAKERRAWTSQESPGGEGD
jgi:hypothetical protein